MSASPGIIIQNTFFSFEEIKKSIPSGMDSYFHDTLEFCHNWLNGMDRIEIRTSGSTGEPKPIFLSKSQIMASVKGSQKALGLKVGMRCLICINTNYIGGKMMLIRSMEIGMQATLVSPSSLPLSDSTQEFDFFSFAPLQMENLLEQGYSNVLNNSKVIIIGGGTISNRLEKQVKEISSPCFHTYGMTETVSHIALRRLNGDHKSANFSALEGIQLRTDDRECLEIYGEVTGNQWIRTTDVVELISKREFIYKGRIDDVINSGGIKIHLHNLENEIASILSNKGIQNQFFLSSEKDEKLGERLILILEAKEVPDDLSGILKDQLPDYHAPLKIYSIEEFSLTETGKIRKQEVLRKLSIL